MTPVSFAGIESRFNEPNDKKYHVSTISDALSAAADFNVPNMVIFVRNEKSFYYLKDGASGTSLADWTKMSGNQSIFQQYVPSAGYVLGETAAIGANMFIAITTIAPAESPITNPEKWLQIISVAKLKVPYINQTSVTVNHGIQNAICNVYMTDTGKTAGVVITKQTASTFLIESNQPLSCDVIIS